VLKGGAGGLACRRTPSCKRSDVLNLENTDIREWWPRVIAGLTTGLEILRDDCKVILPKWLPYQTMLAPLAAVLAKAGFPKTAEAGVHRDKLKRWFWCAVLGQAYESAPNSQSVRDVTALTEWLGGGPLPETIAAFRFDPKALRDVPLTSGGLWVKLIAINFVPRISGWLLTAVVSGSLMHVILQRSSSRVGEQLYTRFD
jgi:hypothetical protein